MIKKQTLTLNATKNLNDTFILLQDSFHVRLFGLMLPTQFYTVSFQERTPHFGTDQSIMLTSIDQSHTAKEKLV